MEAAIRNALERAGAENAQARAKVYHSARAALERNIEKRGIDDPGQRAQQLARLDEMLARIEADFSGAPTVTVVSPPEPGPISAESPEHPVSTNPADAAIPSVVGEVRGTSSEAQPITFTSGNTMHARREPDFGAAAPEGYDEPQISAGNPDLSARRPEADDGLTLPPPLPKSEPAAKASKSKAPKTKNKRRPLHAFAGGFSGIVILCFLAMGTWWAIESGAFQSAADRDTSVPNPPPSVESEDYEGDGSAPRPLNPEAGFSGDWTTIFAPHADQALTNGGAASARLIDGENGRALEITSASAGDDGEIRIPIAAAELQQLAGRKSVIAITARAVGDDTAQFYVKCDFGTLGGCDRRRFRSSYEVSDALIEVDYSGRMAPASDGAILINSDITGEGHAIEIFTIRVRPAE